METNKKSPILGFITYDPKSSVSVENAQVAAAHALQNYQLIPTKADTIHQFRSIVPNVSIKDPYSRRDYENFRPNESIPTASKDIIACCMESYKNNGLIHNIIDLMSDFSTQGMQLVHPNKQIQKFYRGWWEHVNGNDRSERFVNLLLRAGNVILKRVMAKLNAKHEDFIRSLGQRVLEPDQEDNSVIDVARRTIPIRYDFINPLMVDIVGGELSQFVGQQIYVIQVSTNLGRMVRSPRNDSEKELVKLLPPDIYQAILSGNKYIVLPQEKLRVFHYKKDDWQDWAYPMVYPIYNDLILLEKMKLADLAALDGAISQIRLWKLGDLEKGIWPTDAAISKLVEILMSNPGGGAFDLIWGPDINVEEYKTNVHLFLGNAKYEPVLNNIYAGLGIPPTLTGSSTASGFTNNYISLKTLIQRLEYIRDVLCSFWAYEIELVRKAMGFRFAAEIRFDRMILTDESAEKKLLMDLADRLQISDETLRERIGESDELEVLRLRREARERKSGTRTPKGGPWIDPEKDYNLVKIALQRALISPKEAGIDIEDKYKEPPFIMQVNKPVGGPSSTKTTKGIPSQGRPKNAKDSQKRKQKVVKTRVSADLFDSTSKLFVTMSWAKEAQQVIADIITPGMLDYYKKKDVRSFTTDEFNNVERLKFIILANTPLFTTIGVSQIREMMNKEIVLPKEYSQLYSKFIGTMIAEKGKELTIDELRQAQSAIYALLNNGDEDELSNTSI